MSQEIRSILAEGLTELSLSPSYPELESLAGLAELVSIWGRRVNLTGHDTAAEIARRLILDAAALLTVLPEATSVADLGSGAGFPGLPLAILCKERQFVLVESRERRHHFQRQAVRSLGLENVLPLRGRFDQIPSKRCDLVIAQAVGSPDDLVPAMIRWAVPGATLAIPGGELPRRGGPVTAISSDRVREYRVPLGGPARTVWLGRAARQP